MFPLAITAGNTFVLKPSERDPGAAVMLLKLAEQAGVPKGVLNMIHGSRVCFPIISLLILRMPSILSVTLPKSKLFLSSEETLLEDTFTNAEVAMEREFK